MKNYPMEKYRFYTNGKKVVAVSTYAGKTVRGVATCNPTDTFDFEKGKQLAAARCAVKVAEKRFGRATKKAVKALKASLDAKRQYSKASDYLTDANAALTAAEDQLANILESF